jgi:hypothetical protein
MFGDLVKISKEVEIRGVKVTITALSFGQMERIKERLPILARSLSGNLKEDDDPFQGDMKIAMIVAALGKEGDKEVEKELKEVLTIGELNDLWTKVTEISMAATNYPSAPSA